MTSYRTSSAVAGMANGDVSAVLPAASPAASVGDLGLVWITGAASATPTYAAPSGWTALPDASVYDPGSPGVSLVAFWKVLTSSDLASSTWGWDPAHGVIVTLTAYAPASGKRLRVVEASAVPAGSTSSATRTTPTLATGGTRWISTAYADRSGSTWTVPAGQTTRHNVQRGTGASSILVTDSAGDVAAGSVSRTATASASTSTRAEGIVAIEEYTPESAGGGSGGSGGTTTDGWPSWLPRMTGQSLVQLLMAGTYTPPVTTPPATGTGPFSDDFSSDAFDV